MDDFIGSPTVEGLKAFKKDELLDLAGRLEIEEIKRAMRKPAMQRRIAEYYLDEETFSQEDVDQFPVFKTGEQSLELELKLKELELKQKELDRDRELKQMELEKELKQQELAFKQLELDREREREGRTQELALKQLELEREKEARMKNAQAAAKCRLKKKNELLHMQE